uniref:Uncharacterized protein n=1 Tax=Anguilla anguilla TaxID=7936 RepID=A0A0E9U5G3_ANGAN
MAAWILDLAL